MRNLALFTSLVIVVGLISVGQAGGLTFPNVFPLPNPSGALLRGPTFQFTGWQQAAKAAVDAPLELEVRRHCRRLAAVSDGTSPP